MFFTTEKIGSQLREIHELIYRRRLDIPTFKFMEGQCQGAERADFDDRGWADFHIGDSWGGYDVVAWFRAWVPVPADLRNKKLALHFLVGPRDGGGSTAETLLYVNGSPLQGIDVWHEEAWLPPELLRSGEILVALKAWSGVLKVPERRRFKLAQLVWIDESAERFYFQADTLLKAIEMLGEDDLRRIRLTQLLNEAFHCIDFLKPGSEAFYRSVASAGQQLSAGLEKLQIEEMKPKVTAIGHSHIDMAWLWRLSHSREKAARTFSTVLHLMRQYPEYRYLHSSPQLYQYLKADYPEIYQQVKKMIAAGQWEITGGMWVEADTNITGAESLVRQFLLGKRFMREEFGVETNILWLPDVFGYSAALPQMIKKAGLKYFLTTKISWNQFNRFPYDTFQWRGIDGSEVLTHFVTTPDAGASFYTYNGILEPREVKGIWENYQQKEINDELLLLFGWGDGGGGPTREMLESARVIKNIPGLPEVEIGKAEPYFARLEKRLAGKPLPVWDGELYLELHRGTYTSQAENKRSNRLSEILFHNAEWLNSLAGALVEAYAYPSRELHTGWELILVNQFHDILPGSSIHSVYEDCRRDYAAIREIGSQALTRASEAVAGQISLKRESLIVFNPLSWKRDGLVALPWSDEMAKKTVFDAHGKLSPVQMVEEDGEKKILYWVDEVPSLGYRAYPLTAFDQNGPVSEGEILRKKIFPPAFQNGGYYRTDKNRHIHLPLKSHKKAGILDERPAPAGDRHESLGLGDRLRRHAASSEQKAHIYLTHTPQNEFSVAADLLENRFYRIHLNRHGQITSIWDKRQRREVLAPGSRGNVLQVFEDKPANFDAWDIDIFYQEKMAEIDDLLEARLEEPGPLRGVLRLHWRYADSEIIQRLTIYRDSPRIDFRTEVDWHEHQVLLKAAFPVQIRATRATYDIQFGNIERPTHWNTSWDTARFETLAHKWVDLSEGNYGVGLLNNCKYGHDVKDSVMRITLIKSAVDPDPQADQGRHIFTYSLLPHAGDWRAGGVAREAYALNDPLIAGAVRKSQPGALPPEFQFVEVDAANVIIETVKKAEQGEAWILRLYENEQSRLADVHLRFGRPLLRAAECNLVEEEETPVFFNENSLTFSIAPYEIKTFKVWFS